MHSGDLKLPGRGNRPPKALDLRSPPPASIEEEEGEEEKAMGGDGPTTRRPRQNGPIPDYAERRHAIHDSMEPLPPESEQEEQSRPSRHRTRHERDEFTERTGEQRGRSRSRRDDDDNTSWRRRRARTTSSEALPEDMRDEFHGRRHSKEGESPDDGGDDYYGFDVGNYATSDGSSSRSASPHSLHDSRHGGEHDSRHALAELPPRHSEEVRRRSHHATATPEEPHPGQELRPFQIWNGRESALPYYYGESPESADPNPNAAEAAQSSSGSEADSALRPLHRDKTHTTASDKGSLMDLTRWRKNSRGEREAARNHGYDPEKDALERAREKVAEDRHGKYEREGKDAYGKRHRGWEGRAEQEEQLRSGLVRFAKTPHGPWILGGCAVLVAALLGGVIVLILWRTGTLDFTAI
ncbi:hypothetical protein JCM10908_005164 [Rhodotorula pacifica]|uniref:uncharacterized protein n=1 Tax=Rhodotorula pacifica TaxID=1495444 RepID=UPI00317D1AB3